MSFFFVSVLLLFSFFFLLFFSSFFFHLSSFLSMPTGHCVSRFVRGAQSAAQRAHRRFPHLCYWHDLGLYHVGLLLQHLDHQRGWTKKNRKKEDDDEKKNKKMKKEERKRREAAHQQIFFSDACARRDVGAGAGRADRSAMWFCTSHFRHERRRHRSCGRGHCRGAVAAHRELWTEHCVWPRRRGLPLIPTRPAAQPTKSIEKKERKKEKERNVRKENEKRKRNDSLILLVLFILSFSFFFFSFLWFLSFFLGTCRCHQFSTVFAGEFANRIQLSVLTCISLS